jgi:hypothetical protein
VLGELVAAGARLTGPMPPMASDEVASSPPAEPPGDGDGLIAGGPASRPRSARHGSRPVWWRRRVPVLLAAILLVASVGVLVFNLPGGGATPDQLTGRHTPITATPTPAGQGLAAEAAVRTKAIGWILAQVSRAAIVSCDPRVCIELGSKGFPSADLETLGPTSTDPLGSDLVVATAAIRAQFAGRLANVYAPAIIASFGSGNDRIDIRLVYPGGTATYTAFEQAALRIRKEADAQLLANSQIVVSATARAQLLSGDIDPRLPLLLAALAASHPVRIMDFVDQSPGGGPASLLRSVDLAAMDPAAHLARVAYLHWMQAFVNAQTAQYLPAWAQPITPRNSQPVLRIGYQAPSPLS